MRDIDEQLEEWSSVGVHWAVVQEWLNARIEGCKTRLCDESGTATAEAVRKIQGEVTAYRVMLSLPETQIKRLEETRTHGKK